MPGNPDQHEQPLAADASPTPRFVWPPRAPDQASPRAPAPRPAPTQSGFSSALTHIERTWLGLVSAPWHVRVAEARWTPDLPEDYCWRCGARAGVFGVTPPESAQPGCAACREQKVPWNRFVRLGDYQGELRRAIQEVKFGRWRQLGVTLGQELGRSLMTPLAWEKIDRERLVLVPVPASGLRRLRSGIDHSLVIARGVQEVVGGRIARPIRRRHGPSQLEVPRSERARNAARAFVPVEGWRRWVVPWVSPWNGAGLDRRNASETPNHNPTTVIVIDDVRTTGATMVAACRAVLAAWRGMQDERKGASGGRGDSGRRGGPSPRIWAAVVGVTPERGRSRGFTGDVEDPLGELPGAVGLEV